MLRRLLEYLLAIIGVAFCIGAAFLFAQYQSSSLWPLPGLYLFEIAVLGTLGLVGILMDDQPRSPRLGLVVWAVAGGLLAFVILGAWTIGPFLTPSALAFCLAGALADWRHQRNIWPHLGVWVMAALAQALLMLVVIVLP